MPAELVAVHVAGEVAPVAADTEVDVARHERAVVGAPPTQEMAWLGQRVPHERGGRIEAARDEDLAVGGQRDGGAAVAGGHEWFSLLLGFGLLGFGLLGSGFVTDGSVVAVRCSVAR